MDTNKPQPKNRIALSLVGLALLVIVLAGYFFLRNSGSWTLVGESTEKGKYRIDGFKTSKECLERALALSKEGDYYNCGRACKDSSSTVDGIMCKEYCGPGGCSKP